jgi:hypothetical protein
MRSNQFVHAMHQTILLLHSCLAAHRRVTLRAPRLIHHPARTPLRAVVERLFEMLDDIAFAGRAQCFPR